MEQIGVEKVFEEKVSAKDINRPELKKLMDFVQSGDTVYVKDFSRLARSTKDLLGLVEFFKQKNVNLVSLKESFDLGTSTGKLMITMMAAIYEFERSNMLERQAEGIAAAQAKGDKLGRHCKELPPNYADVVEKWNTGQISTLNAISQLNISRSTLYRLASKKAPD